MRVQSLVRIAAAAALFAFAVPGRGHAQIAVFDFTANGLGNLGNTETFSLSGYGTIDATGYNDVLWAKNEGVGETGLGLCGDVRRHRSGPDTCNNDAEIGNDDGYLTLALHLLPDVTPVSFELASVQTGEKFQFEVGTSNGCDNLGSANTGTGPNDGDPFAFEGLASSTGCIEFDPVSSFHCYVYYNGHCYYGMTKFDQGDYLLESLTVDKTEGGGGPLETVPEPTTMAMLGMGLVGLAGAARRRRKPRA